MIPQCAAGSHFRCLPLWGAARLGAGKDLIETSLGGSAGKVTQAPAQRIPCIPLGVHPSRWWL